MEKVSFFWFRRDLRLNDNVGLYYALSSGRPIIPVFIFDKDILDSLEDPYDKRVNFIYQALKELNDQLKILGSSLKVKHGKPSEVWEELLREYDIDKVFTNHDYEPYALKRDKSISELLDAKAVSFHTYKDQVIFEKDEILKENQKPYTVYTPYSRKWKASLSDFYLHSYPTEKYTNNFYKTSQFNFPKLEEIGFKSTGYFFEAFKIRTELIRDYENTRNIPGRDGTSRIGVHLRFGTISIRKLVSGVRELSEDYLNELIWREFFMSILYHFPKVVEHSFKSEYDRIEWRNEEAEFEKWCNGQTGYPLVDAGMRELNETGFIHNRVRMVTASFLCKHLLIDWRWGEAYFAKKLLDYDLASNNGNWQWVAGCGCDTAPYFRIFNPYLQAEKFDKASVYIQKWVPEYGRFEYVKPLVDHEFARRRALDVYKGGLKGGIAGWRLDAGSLNNKLRDSD